MVTNDQNLYICVGLGVAILILVAYQVNVNRKQQTEIENIKVKTDSLEEHMKVLADAVRGNLEKTSRLQTEFSYNHNNNKKSSKRGKKKKSVIENDVDLVSAALG